MEKYIYDEKNGLWFELQGDYSSNFSLFLQTFFAAARQRILRVAFHQ
ncbi:MAG: hypothetical protein ACOX21_06820 [Bacillota bacterium]